MPRDDDIFFLIVSLKLQFKRRLVPREGGVFFFKIVSLKIGGATKLVPREGGRGDEAIHSA